jgi:hypothetical protein
MVEPEQPVEDRVVFFEVPRGADCIAQLKQVLACNWCADTEHWYERGYISNIEPAFDLLKRAAGNDRTGDLRIFEIGIGGAPPLAVGPKRIQYARASHVDLFTSPRVTKRLRRLLDVIDDLYAASAVAER